MAEAIKTLELTNVYLEMVLVRNDLTNLIASAKHSWDIDDEEELRDLALSRHLHDKSEHAVLWSKTH